MAYSNWGAKVFRNGVRMRNREDVGVYEDEAIFANILKNREKEETDKWWEHPHHAVLGDAEVRLCAYKNDPELWIWKEGEKEPKQVQLLNEEDWDKYWNEDRVKKEGEIRVNGKIWKWYFEKYRNMIDLSLVEPDGTVWIATAGYQYGAGFED